MEVDMLKLILAIFAIACFFIGFLNKWPAYDWISGGLMFSAAAVFLPI